MVARDTIAPAMSRSDGRSLGRLAGFLERAYERLGPRYPDAAVRGQLQLVYGPVLLNVSALALFVDLSIAELLRLIGTACAGFFVYNLIYMAAARPLLAPVRRWVEGDRDRAATIAAWTACAGFPREMMRREWLAPVPGLVGEIGLLVWAGYATWEMDVAAYTIIPLAAGVAVFVVYVQLLRFFVLERVLHPVLNDIARHARDERDLYALGLPVRDRLLAALPAINVITGVAAVGIVGSHRGLDLADLGLAVIVSAAIAATVSLALTILLADSITAPIAALREATQRVGRGDLAARVPVVTTDETGGLAQSFNQMTAGLEQRERLREAFGTFVDPDLTDRVLQEGTDLAGEEVELSLLFMDIRDFTTYSENAAAREVVARLNDLYGEVVPIILRHGGHANKFIGDGLLAVFGAPSRLANHADHAVAAGLEIAATVRARYDGELRIGIGINSGEAVVGTIGGGGRLDFTVIGDAVNTAARVESATRQTGDDVLITEATHQALTRDHGDWDERPPIALKGKTRQVRLHGPSPRAG